MLTLSPPFSPCYSLPAFQVLGDIDGGGDFLDAKFQWSSHSDTQRRRVEGHANAEGEGQGEGKDKGREEEVDQLVRAQEQTPPGLE